MRILSCLLLLVLCLPAAPARAFDQDHAAWTTLLARHVQWNPEGTATTVDYAGFARDRSALKAYLDELSAVERSAHDAWTKPQREAFLINAYNAYTVELVLTGYPGIESIKDLGSFIRSPWKQRFFDLLGEQRHLDDVEHGLLRGAPGFDEPRIHFAVNCASIGCPALRPEAFTAAALEAQLEEQTRRFLADRTRNRWDPGSRTLQLSPIFDWYGGDFEKPWRGTAGVQAFAARYRDAMALDDAAVALLSAGGARLSWTDYDWSLNAPPAARR